MRHELGQTVHWHGKVVFINRNGQFLKTVTHSDHRQQRFGGDGVPQTTFHFKNLVWDEKRKHWDFHASE